MNKLTN